MDGIRRRGVYLNDSGDLREFQYTLDHALHPGQAQCSPQLLKSAQTSHDGSHAGTIDIGHTRQVEDDPPLILANDPVHLLLDLLAARSNGNAACHLEGDNAGPDLLFGKFHGFFRLTLNIGLPSGGINGCPARPDQFHSSPS